MSEKTINVTKIKNLSSLVDLKSTLTEFLTNPEVSSVYTTDFGTMEEYNSIVKSAKHLLKKIDQQIKIVNQQAKKQEIPQH